jgi:hypothetical protein
MSVAVQKTGLDVWGTKQTKPTIQSTVTVQNISSFSTHDKFVSSQTEEICGFGWKFACILSRLTIELIYLPNVLHIDLSMTGIKLDFLIEPTSDSEEPVTGPRTASLSYPSAQGGTGIYPAGYSIGRYIVGKNTNCVSFAVTVVVDVFGLYLPVTPQPDGVLDSLRGNIRNAVNFRLYNRRVGQGSIGEPKILHANKKVIMGHCEYLDTSPYFIFMDGDF